MEEVAGDAAVDGAAPCRLGTEHRQHCEIESWFASVQFILQKVNVSIKRKYCFCHIKIYLQVSKMLA